MSILQTILDTKVTDLKGFVNIPEGDYIFTLGKEVKMEEKLSKANLPQVVFSFEAIIKEVLTIKDASFDLALTPDLIGKSKSFKIYSKEDQVAGLKSFLEGIFGTETTASVNDMLNMIKTGTVTCKATLKLNEVEKRDAAGNLVLNEVGEAQKTKFIEVDYTKVSKA